MVKTVAQKMGIKSDMRTIFIDKPDEVLDLFEWADVTIDTKLKDDFDCVLFFVKEEKKLQEKISFLKQHLKSPGMLWISWPKGGQLDTNLSIKSIIFSSL